MKPVWTWKLTLLHWRTLLGTKEAEKGKSTRTTCSTPTTKTPNLRMDPLYLLTVEKMTVKHHHNNRRQRKRRKKRSLMRKLKARTRCGSRRRARRATGALPSTRNSATEFDSIGLDLLDCRVIDTADFS